MYGLAAVTAVPAGQASPITGITPAVPIVATPTGELMLPSRLLPHDAVRVLQAHRL